MPTVNPPQRLPIVNSDDGTWGDILRQYLMKEHFNDDTDSAANGGHQKITIRAGTATAGTAPLKFTSGTLLTTPEAGAVEFNTDSLYLTQTTGAIRKKIAVYDDTSGATGDIYYRNSSGYFTRLAAGSTGDILTVAGGLPTWSSSLLNATSLTVKDANFTIQDDVDTTKQVKFQASGISTATTRTLTVPDVSSTIEVTANKNAANGYIGADASGKVAFSSLANDIYNTTPTASALVQWDTNKNIRANAMFGSFTTTVTDGGTTTLTTASTQIQEFTGTTTQTVKLPTTSVPQGAQYQIINNSTGSVTVKSSGSNTIVIMAFGTSAIFTAAVPTPTTDANWVYQYIGTEFTSGKKLNILNTLTLAGTDDSVMTFPSTSGTVVTLDAPQTLTSKTISGSYNTFSNIGISAISATGTPSDTTYLRGDGTWSTVSGTADVSTNTTTSVDSEVALFSGTGGKTLKRATGSGIAKLTSGVLSTVTAPAGAIVGTTDTQTLTNKTLTAPVIATITNTGTLTLPTSTDTLVGRATTDTLTNKTISGSSNTLSNIGISSLSATGTASSSTYLRGDGTWSTLTLPAVSSFAQPVGDGVNSIITVTHNLNTRNVIVSVKESDTYTEVDCDVVANTANSITLGFGEVPTSNQYFVTIIADSVATAAVNEGSVFADNLFTIQNATDTTKKIQFSASGLTTSTTRTITIPDASTTLVGTNTTQTLTNKTISGSSNTLSNIGVSSLSATGTPSASTYLRGDGTWTAVDSLPSQTGNSGKYLTTNGTSASWATVTTGDASTNTATSVDSEVALFSGTGGKTLKRATGSGIAKLTSGVLSTVTAPSGAIVGDTDTQTLTNKTISGSSNTLSNIALSSLASAAYSATPTASTLAQWDANKNLNANALIPGFRTQATAGGTTTLTIADAQVQVFTGTSSNQTVKLPTTSVVAGAQYLVVNQSTTTGVVTVQSSVANLITYLPGGSTATFTALVDTPTTAAHWKCEYLGGSRPRIDSVASSGTPSINTDITEQFNITALATPITSMTTNLTGNPTDGQKLLIRIKDNGSPRTVAWGTSFQSSGIATLLATTVGAKVHQIGLVYDAVLGKWVCLASDEIGY